MTSPLPHAATSTSKPDGDASSRRPSVRPIQNSPECDRSCASLQQAASATSMSYIAVSRPTSIRDSASSASTTASDVRRPPRTRGPPRAGSPAPAPASLERRVLLDRRSVIVVPASTSVRTSRRAPARSRVIASSSPRAALSRCSRRPVEQVPPHATPTIQFGSVRRVEVVLNQLLLPEEAHRRQVTRRARRACPDGPAPQGGQTANAGITAVCGEPERFASLEAVDRRQRRRGTTSSSTPSVARSAAPPGRRRARAFL